MSYWYLYVILAYFLVLGVLNFLRARQVSKREDFMVAGRKLPMTIMVFTLICTWIGSGTFIAGAEYAAEAGWSSMWMPAGAWIGIVIIYFLAARIRTFGQFTVGDILEARYGKAARFLGAVCIVIAFTTIVSYQFRAGGYILNVASRGAISVETGQAIAAGFVILFTALGGMVAVAHTDLPNGIIIVLACCAAVPFTVAAAGGWTGGIAELPSTHVQVFAEDFGRFPALKAASYCLATLLLLMGIQSMYQKFYSARSPSDARRAVAIWIVGTIVVEVVVIVIAIYAASLHWSEIRAFKATVAVKEEVKAGALGADGVMARIEELVAADEKAGRLDAGQAGEARAILARDLAPLSGRKDAILGATIGTDPRSIVLVAAQDTIRSGGIGILVGLLLLAAACAVVLSTGMNYLLSPSTNVIRDIWEKTMGRKVEEKKALVLQRVFVVVLGLCAFLMIWVPTVLHSDISVLRYAYFAYTMYGVTITPALLAALAWKRATRAGGFASIVTGASATILLDLIVPNAFPGCMRGSDPFGIPSIFVALAASVTSLVVVSLLTPPPDRETLEKLFPREAGKK